MSSSTSTSLDVTFPSLDGSVTLAGTVTAPSGPVTDLRPAVVIIHGSGRVDRNGNPPAASGIEIHVYSKLASFFTDELGWVCLRYDKRGTGASTNGDKLLFTRAGMSDLAQDAVQATKLLSTMPRVDASKVILAGHSEGAILLAQVAKLVGQPIHGLFYVAGFGESLEIAVRCQQSRAVAEIAVMKGFQAWLMRRFLSEKSLQKKIDDLKAKVNKTDKDVITEYCGLVKTPAKWWREHFAYDLPRIHADCARVTSHVLIITGAKDVQCRAEFCTVEHAKSILTQAASVTCAVPAKMTHLLRPMEGTPSLVKSMEEYKKTAKDPLDSEFVDAVRQWARAIEC
ncbi:Aste57867_14912 [Aphanomyces stellatus]|uniref:Aste57867_14912 protein n=1 Tax=Aphanomyces stellatus TaxID=120398 RepID=A0A485L3N0_9STRA|nr:hypothetical protein As57867_014856 [Aphanomyces stellatus]VFT91727.1 Aste57867_14912 [Aphanomyces stellatus]